MDTPHYRVRTVEVWSVVNGLWNSTVFIYHGDSETPCAILLHAGRGRSQEEAERLANQAAQEWLRDDKGREEVRRRPRPEQ
ncbi:hypothetical protein P6166_14540 [Stenotrophomonas sp. HITSZ_GD]|uniref:hypothetical protein n=1 Tax=Stenotrophomonas sp. HITSZ_GD TaxID=3037248 RepID=UPI00240DE13A|nr:hypothetical protein [Stenotrophomonas sp. HITSZ_GD]MDG2526572.1 hypothetical protein [Stenotrophomonas sp. HITSZ_GD]